MSIPFILKYLFYDAGCGERKLIGLPPLVSVILFFIPSITFFPTVGRVHPLDIRKCLKKPVRYLKSHFGSSRTYRILINNVVQAGVAKQVQFSAAMLNCGEAALRIS